MSNIIEVNDSNFIEISSSVGVFLIYFTAPWCGPCRLMSPILESTSEKLKNDIKFMKLVVDDNPELSTKYNIVSIPTMIIVKDGKELARNFGMIEENKFIDWIKNNI